MGDDIENQIERIGKTVSDILAAVRELRNAHNDVAPSPSAKAELHKTMSEFLERKEKR
jgi:hypothetical protein